MDAQKLNPIDKHNKNHIELKKLIITFVLFGVRDLRKFCYDQQRSALLSFKTQISLIFTSMRK